MMTGLIGPDLRTSPIVSHARRASGQLGGSEKYFQQRVPCAPKKEPAPVWAGIKHRDVRSWETPASGHRLASRRGVRPLRPPNKLVRPLGLGTISATRTRWATHPSLPPPASRYARMPAGAVPTRPSASISEVEVGPDPCRSVQAGPRA